MGKDLIKYDIMFLEYPLWFQNSTDAEKQDDGYVWKNREGYIYRAGYKPPVKTDIIFLMYFLLESQRQGWKEKIYTTPYEVLKSCGIEKNTWWYERIKESLERWKMVGIKFAGTFYDGKKYHTLNFGIIDSWGLEEKTKRLWVRFSPEWLLQIKESTFFKHIHFEQIKALRSPLALRLYEILIKNFQTRTAWKVSADKLAQKIPMNEKYPAHIIPKITTAINSINKHTALNIALIVSRPARGQAILTFQKTVNAKNLDSARNQPPGLESLLMLVPEKHRKKKTLQATIANTLARHNAGYVRRNILYANEKADKSYRVFLLKALKNDWGHGWQEDQKAEDEQRQVEHKKDEAAKKAELIEKEKIAGLDNLIASLTPQQDAELTALAEEKIILEGSEFQKKMYLRKKREGKENLFLKIHKRELIVQFKKDLGTMPKGSSGQKTAGRESGLQMGV